MAFPKNTTLDVVMSTEYRIVAFDPITTETREMLVVATPVE
ncbi:hypothetical protein [Devosia psychrophila]|nr:hypothetical protein [Devosia psychrophila]